MNNGKYNTSAYKAAQAAKMDRNFGPIIDHKKTCECCGDNFIWTGREKTKAFAAARFCKRSCSNSVGGKALALLREETGISHYTTLCKKYHEWKCVVCGEERILAVHHLNEDHTDDRPQNLIPLCPTHHQYVHSKYRDLVQPIIDKYAKDHGLLVYLGTHLPCTQE